MSTLMSQGAPFGESPELMVGGEFSAALEIGSNRVHDSHAGRDHMEAGLDRLHPGLLAEVDREEAAAAHGAQEAATAEARSQPDMHAEQLAQQERREEASVAAVAEAQPTADTVVDLRESSPQSAAPATLTDRLTHLRGTAVLARVDDSRRN